MAQRWSDDLEAKRQRAQFALQAYQTEPWVDKPMIAPTTDNHRHRNMASWKAFFTDVMQVDPDQIWLDLCLGQPSAVNYCRVYLRSYVENSVQKVVVLGPEEFEHRRGVNSASSVTQCWRDLIAQADCTVLRAKRAEEPEKSQLWSLKFHDHTNQRARGPVFEISRWIFEHLAKELNLAVTLTFEKLEATAEDVIVLLNTLWARADDIPCRPNTRLSFHGIILLAAIGGFRQGAIKCLTYRDVCLAVVRDPNDRSKTKLVVTPTIGKNKLRRASRVTRAIAISFSMTLVPYSTICLASIIAARAIKDDAFDPSFESVEALLSRPALESVDFLPLKWKKEMLDRSIFELSPATFYNLWRRTCLVSGLRVDPRFYAMRVGAGARLDGVLTDALRNYILSNTTQVFQGSYQTKRVREDLLKLAFGPMAGHNNDSLFQSLRNMSLRRDAGAPVDPSVEDVQGFEKRNDLRTLRASLETARLENNAKKMKSTRSQIDNLVATLSLLTVEEKRREYFDRVDNLRAQGLPTLDDCTKDTLDRPPKNGTAGAIAAFLQKCTSNVAETNLMDHRSKLYMNLLVDYLAFRPPKADPMDNEGDQTTRPGSSNDDCHSPNDGAQDHLKQSMCLLGCGFFRSRSELTKHCKNIHLPNGTFEKPFHCPECLSSGLANTLIEGGPSAWSNHVESVHGKRHAPNLPSEIRPVKPSLRCLLCEGHYASGGGLTRHVRKTHDEKLGDFNHPFPCPECRRQSKGDTQINGTADWYHHMTKYHRQETGLTRSLDSFLDGCREAVTNKRKAADDDETPVTGAHPLISISDPTDGFTSNTAFRPSPAESDIIWRIDPVLLQDTPLVKRAKVSGGLSKAT